MPQSHTFKDWKYGYTNGFIVVNYRYNPTTDKKDITDYYTGSREYTNNAKTFTSDIEKAEFFPIEKSALNMIRVLNASVPGYPGVFCYMEKAHCEYY